MLETAPYAGFVEKAKILGAKVKFKIPLKLITCQQSLLGPFLASQHGGFDNFLNGMQIER